MQHIRLILCLLLDYLVAVLLFASPQSAGVPALCRSGSDSDAASSKPLDSSYHAVLINDESHTFDMVIKALERATGCTREQATLLATIVDREVEIYFQTHKK